MKDFKFTILLSLLIALFIVTVVEIDNIYAEVERIDLNVQSLMIEDLVVEESSNEVEVVVEDNDNEPKYVPIGNFKITGYDAKCEHCCGKSDGITASMTEAKVGITCAMNRSDMKKLGLEYGDVVLIDGLGDRIIEDTGCAEGVIDVVCANHEECYKITGTYQIWAKDVT